MRARAARGGRHAGMSLVELLVGIALTGLVATAIFAVFDRGTEASRAHEAQAQSQAGARLALAMIGTDVRQAVGPGEGDAPVLTIGPAEIVVHVDDRRSPDPTLGPLPWRVRYALEDGALVRERAQPVVDAGGDVTYPGPYTGREVLVEAVVNDPATQPVFTGRERAGDATVDPARIAAVSVRLRIGHRVNQLTVEDEVSLDVTLRNA